LKREEKRFEEGRGKREEEVQRKEGK